MSPRRRFALAATVLVCASLSGCAGLGLPPAAPVLTPGTSATAASATPTTAAPTASPAPTGGQSPAPTTAAPTEATPTASPSGEVPDTVSTMAGGNGTARPLLVPTSALPAGWTATKARDTRGYRMTVCGVDLEPTEPVDAAQQNWQASAAGPYLEQHVRVYPDATATTVTAALAKAIPGCRSYTAKDAKGSSTFTVEKLALKGAPKGTVAWRQRVPVPVPGSATGTTPPATAEVTQDVAVRRIGASIVLMTAYAVERTPDDATLTKALTALG